MSCTLTTLSTVLWPILWPVLGSVWSVLGTVLLWIALILGGLLFLLLMVPIQFRAQGSVREGDLDSALWGRATIRWGWGFVSVRYETKKGATLHLLGLRIYRLKLGDEKSRDKPKKPKKPRKRGRLLQTFRYRRTAMRLAGRLLGSLRLRARVAGTVGLDDPADTALLMQFIWAIDHRLKRADFDVEPNYLDEGISVEGEGRGLVWPVHVCLVLLGAYLRRETREMIRAVR